MKASDEIHRLDNMIRSKEITIENMRAVVWGEKLAYIEDLNKAEEYIRSAQNRPKKKWG